MSQITHWVIESPVPESPATLMRDDVIYRYRTFDLTVAIVPLEKTHTVIQRHHNQDAVARPRKPSEITTQTFSLSTQWRVFQHNFEAISPEEQHQVFRICAAIAPEHNRRTDAEWRDSIRRLPSTETNCLSPLLLHVSFEVFRTSCAAPHLLHDPRLLQRSANDNLAELRKLLGATEDISCNILALEDRIVRGLPIGFTKKVYESLPSALINILPFETVSRALSMIDEMEPRMRKPNHKFGVLLWQCAVSQEDSILFRDWMASDDGKLHYCRVKDSLRQPLTQEEVELSLTTLRCYELVLAPDYWWRDVRPLVPANSYVRGSKRREESWIDAFTKHLNGLAQKPPLDLWKVAGSSFKDACNDAPLRWLDAVLDKRPPSDVFVQTYWQFYLTVTKDASCNALAGQAMQRQASQRGY